MATVRLAAIVSIGVLLTGCEVASDCPTDWCGTIVVTSGAEANSLSPLNIETGIDVSLQDLIFEKLAYVGSSMNTYGDVDFVPGLAASWSFPNDRTIRFAISDDARWHDGTAVSAGDVVFTFDVYGDPVVATGATSRLAFIESVTAVDDRTVDVRFSTSYQEMFFDAVYHVRVLPQHILGDVPHDELAAHAFARNPVGSGPFRFVRWDASEQVELAGDPDYHRGRPGVPSIVWRFAADGQQALTQLLAGEADVLNPVQREEDRLRVDNAEDYRTIPYTVPVYAYMSFNFRDPDDLNRPHPIFADRAVRRAFVELVDIEEIVTGIFGASGKVAVGPLTSHYTEVYPALTAYPHLADNAVVTLRSLGWADTDGDGVLEKDGQRFEFDLIVPSSSGARIASAEIMQEQLRPHGIRINIQVMEFNAAFDLAESGRFDAVFGALSHDPSAASVTDAWTEAGFDGFNYGHYLNPEFDRLIGQAQTAAEPDEVNRLYREAFTTLVDDVPALWAYVPEIAAAVHVRLQDVSIRPDQWSATMWQWRVDPQDFIARDLIGRN